MSQAGISEAELDAILATERRPREWRNRWEEMVAAPSTETLEDLLPAALDAVSRLVPTNWLADEAQHMLRLDPRRGIELVGGTLLDRRARLPHRLAQMILLGRAHLDERPDLDIFSAASLVPELAALGGRLPLVASLGSEAVRKLGELYRYSSEAVASTLFELFVGTALVQKGRTVEMLTADKSGKSPDLRIHDLAGVPFVVECKRRIGLFAYELGEAETIRAWFAPIRERLAGGGDSVVIDVELFAQMSVVSAVDFADAVGEALARGTAVRPWGTAHARELARRQAIEPTRIYSPDMLASAFGWDFEAGDWDGLIADVNADDCVIDEIVQPRALRWRSRSPEARLKKSRGITSLVGDATQQIPVGEAGAIYVGYNESSQSHADARTQNTLDEIAQRKWFHRPGQQVPLVIASRFIASPRGVGVPDLIESSMILCESGWEAIEHYFAMPVVTAPP